MRRIWDSNKREKKRRGNATWENGKKEEGLPRLKSNWWEGEQSQVFSTSMKLLQQSVCQKFREIKIPLRASMKKALFFPHANFVFIRFSPPPFFSLFPGLSPPLLIELPQKDARTTNQFRFFWSRKRFFSLHFFLVGRGMNAGNELCR